MEFCTFFLIFTSFFVVLQPKTVQKTAAMQTFVCKTTVSYKSILYIRYFNSCPILFSAQLYSNIYSPENSFFA